MVASDLASVVGAVVVPGLFHPPAAPATGEPACQHVAAVVLGSAGIAALVAPEPRPDGLPFLPADQGLMAGLFEPDPNFPEYRLFLLVSGCQEAIDGCAEWELTTDSGKRCIVE
jgi:hypothetical protein